MPTNKKCPPGVICFENVTLYFLISVFIITIVYFYNNTQFKTYANENKSNMNNEIRHSQPNIYGLIQKSNYNLQNDVLLNPYVPPLRDERYFTGDLAFFPPFPAKVPINVSTNLGAVDTNYRQVGILTPLNKNINERILPLLGRPLFSNRDKWQYYSMSDQNNSIKLPVKKNGKNCTNEYGCDSLNSGDVIFVEGYKQAFSVTMYENDTIKYLPFL
jgi:hypothetical protein